MPLPLPLPLPTRALVATRHGHSDAHPHRMYRAGAGGPRRGGGEGWQGKRWGLGAAKGGFNRPPSAPPGVGTRRRRRRRRGGGVRARTAPAAQSGPESAHTHTHTHRAAAAGGRTLQRCLVESFQTSIRPRALKCRPTFLKRFRFLRTRNLPQTSENKLLGPALARRNKTLTSPRAGWARLGHAAAPGRDGLKATATAAAYWHGDVATETETEGRMEERSEG